MARRTGPDAGREGLRAFGGLVCPGCRTTLEPAPPDQRVVRCAVDGRALLPGPVLADDDGDPWLGETVAGRYVVLGRLGAGSTGMVYRALDERTRREVALKVLRSDRVFDATARARFVREARATSLLRSPHTVAVLDLGTLDSGALYLVLELLVGESLGARLRRAGRLPATEAVQVARQVLRSLAEAHGLGIVHRDLKPDNVFLVSPTDDIVDPLESELRCKVLDFGIAKLEARGAPEPLDALQTHTGAVFGTPRYMSPEQAQGKPLDARSDLYSLGVLLYHMLVGRPPFPDGDAAVVITRHIEAIAEAPASAAPGAGIPPSLSRLVMRALAKSPGERPECATAFDAELERAMGGEGAPAGSAPGAAVEIGGGEAASIGEDGPAASPSGGVRESPGSTRGTEGARRPHRRAP